jgi:hypothetical protein
LCLAKVIKTAIKKTQCMGWTDPPFARTVLALGRWRVDEAREGVYAVGLG